MENSTKKLWKYYKDAAGPGKGYSVLSFYEDYSDPENELNDITLAFLGDDAAFQRLKWDEPLPERWEKLLLEPKEGRELNENQKEAVKKALGNAISIIVGPPGTGKTETILNLLSCIGQQGKTAAVVSLANAAVNDICDKIQEEDSGQQNNRTWLKKKFARLGDRKRKKSFKDAKKYTHPGISFDAAEDFLEEFPIVLNTIYSLRNCFENNKNNKNYRFDYVIIDEVSQVNLVMGIMAMSAAKHLVLVGDSAQLPPVISTDEIRKLGDDTISDKYKIKSDKGFLDACMEVLEEKGRLVKTMLTVHYRCHPDIIEFCNRTVYDGKLEIPEKLEMELSGKGPRVPIKVLWFEGDYRDKFFKENNNEKVWFSNKNMKQAMIFMEEEWPELKKRFQKQKQQGKDPDSICILTPFRGQTETLKDLLLKDEDIDKNKLDIKITLDGNEEDSGDQKQQFHLLTIHKSQGREYDIVYFLPVDDKDWQWPWSQKKQMINVAVSRAKKELRLILSASLMDEPIQRELTGRYVLPQEPKSEESGEAVRPEDQRYIQKLVSYVKERSEEARIHGYPDSDYEFGFHRSCRRSIFDDNAWLRQENKGGRGSAPEQCMWLALEDMCRAWKAVLGVELLVYDHVRLKTIRTWTGEMPKLDEATLAEELNMAFRKDVLDKGFQPLEAGDQAEIGEEDADAASAAAEEMQQLVDNGGHLDFVICHGNRILVAIEVDGAGHGRPMERNGLSAKRIQEIYEEQKKKDERKDELLSRIFGADCYAGNERRGNFVQTAEPAGTFAFIRLPTDGTTCLETMKLWGEAPKELQDKYFPIEELIKIQLSRKDFAKEGRAYRLPQKAKA